MLNFYILFGKFLDTNEPTTSSGIVLGNVPIRSRGRGSKKILAVFASSDDENEKNDNLTKTTINKKEVSTLASDNVEITKNKIKTSIKYNEKTFFDSDLSDHDEDYNDEITDIHFDTLEPDLDPTPTPQPWN